MPGPPARTWGTGLLRPLVCPAPGVRPPGLSPPGSRTPTARVARRPGPPLRRVLVLRHPGPTPLPVLPSRRARATALVRRFSGFPTAAAPSLCCLPDPPPDPPRPRLAPFSCLRRSPAVRGSRAARRPLPSGTRLRGPARPCPGHRTPPPRPVLRTPRRPGTDPARLPHRSAIMGGQCGSLTFKKRQSPSETAGPEGCSPRRRGWSVRQACPALPGTVLPVQAGVVR